MRLLAHQAVSGALVDPPRAVQVALRPQGDLAVARLPREALAFGDQHVDTEPARLRLDQEEAELGHRHRLLHQEDAADRLPIVLGDPGALLQADCLTLSTTRPP